MLCWGVRLDWIPSPTLTDFQEMQETSELQFSHLSLGITTATSWESCDERENEGLAPCPVMRYWQMLLLTEFSKPGLQVLIISRVSLAESGEFAFDNGTEATSEPIYAWARGPALPGSPLHCLASQAYSSLLCR